MTKDRKPIIIEIKNEEWLIGWMYGVSILGFGSLVPFEINYKIDIYECRV